MGIDQFREELKKLTAEVQTLQQELDLAQKNYEEFLRAHLGIQDRITVDGVFEMILKVMKMERFVD